MTFLLVYLFVTLPAAYQTVHGLVSPGLLTRSTAPFLGFCLLGALPTLWMVFVAGHQAVHPGYRNWEVPSLMAFALAGVALYGTQLWTRVKAGSHKVGFPVIALVGCIYMASACVNHYWFVRGDQNNVGVLFAGALPWFEHESGCDKAAIVRIEKTTAEYRCQTGTILGGALSHWPFIPWPDYKAGKSVRLKAFLEHINKAASVSPRTIRPLPSSEHLSSAAKNNAHH